MDKSGDEVLERNKKRSETRKRFFREKLIKIELVNINLEFIKLMKIYRQGFQAALTRPGLSSRKVFARFPFER